MLPGPWWPGAGCTEGSGRNSGPELASTWGEDAPWARPGRGCQPLPCTPQSFLARGWGCLAELRWGGSSGELGGFLEEVASCWARREVPEMVDPVPGVAGTAEAPDLGREPCAPGGERGWPSLGGPWRQLAVGAAGLAPPASVPGGLTVLWPGDPAGGPRTIKPAFEPLSILWAR